MLNKTFIFFLAITVLNFSSIFSQDDFAYPSDAVINVVLEYGIDNTGATDVSSSINAIFDELYQDDISNPLDVFKSNHILYFPNGTYLVRDKINWHNENNDNKSGFFTVQGESKSGTILLLDDNSIGYDDQSSPKYIVDCGDPNNNAIYNIFRNFTINTGNNNPGAIGINFTSSNAGGLWNVNIVSGDGNGHTGLDIGLFDMGPFYIRDVEIDGFKYGIFSTFGSIALERIHVKNIFDVGLNVKGRAQLSIRDYSTMNVNTAIRMTENPMVSLMECDFDGIGSDTAIVNRSQSYANLHLKNVSFSDFEFSIYDDSTCDPLTNGTAPPEILTTNFLMEWSSHNAKNIGCPLQDQSLSLTIKETPIVPYAPLTDWVGVKDFGANPNDYKLSPPGDPMEDGTEIQNAINGPESTVYLNSAFHYPDFQSKEDVSIYAVRFPDTLRLNQNIKRFMGCHQMLVGYYLHNQRLDQYHLHETMVIEGGSAGDTLIIEDLFLNMNVLIDDPRVIIFKGVFCKGIVECTANATGDLYFDGSMVGNLKAVNKNIWARSLNVEYALPDPNSVPAPGQAPAYLIDNDEVVIDNCKMWVLGEKSEATGTIFKATNNSQLEISNMLTLSKQETIDEMFDIQNSDFSIANLRVNTSPAAGFGKTLVTVKQETSNNIFDFHFNQSDFIANAENRVFGYYGYSSVGLNTAPVISVPQSEFCKLFNESFQLNVLVGDDGRSSNNCDLTISWSELSTPFGHSVNFSTTDTESTTILPSWPGTYVVEVTVSDGILFSSELITIQVFDQSISTSVGNGADTYIRRNNNIQAEENYNFGGCTDTKVQDINGSAKMYLRFDLNGVPLPVSNVALQLETSLPLFKIPNITIDVYGLKDAHTGENWSEGNGCFEAGGNNDITYNNAPANDVSDNNGLIDAEVDFLGTFTKNNSYGFYTDIFNNPTLKTFVNSDTDGLITLILVINDVSIGSQLTWWATKEHQSIDPPQLCIWNNSANCPLTRHASGTLGGGFVKAQDKVTSDATIAQDVFSFFHAMDCVEFLPGFDAPLGAHVEAYIQGCVANSNIDDNPIKE